MPRYTYECTKCGYSYDKVEGWDAPVQQRCPAECPEGKAGKATARRVPMVPAIVFKGSGFYKTDSRATASGVTSRNGHEGASEPAPEEHGAPDSAPEKNGAPAETPAKTPMKAAAASPAGKASESKPGRSPRPKSRS